MKMILYTVDVLFNAQTPLSSEHFIDSPLLLVSLLVRLQVEHLHNAVIREVPLITKELFDQDFHTFEACGCLKDVNGRSQDINCKVEHSTTWKEAAGMEDNVALRRSTKSQNVCMKTEKGTFSRGSC